ncbi:MULTISPECIES: hypothetical protein [Pelosinus]|uniref:Uncharacterized protein n=1 Tax=Pelosinus fermentans B4 TaxID=1149862 RepID=I9LD11_9FIRM|nr:MULTISPECIES: hypothetical protein [Pelosinus]EIW18304.1 hypothetical protein FB4_3478 [Pelosinus fermentans B4]EIW24290.1 hypothetical protein FA11_3479 [Pelosinus fermentans A11]OAM94264.1 hypothetical protein FR7_02282 [Pelosinus fermentans DSM 17108]SDR04556.1 hypothetical protein SAMN04515679_2386 [Pelosinus fermentans]
MDYRNWEDPQIEDWENRSEDERQALFGLGLALGLGLGFGFTCSPRRHCNPRRYCWPRQGCWPR